MIEEKKLKYVAMVHPYIAVTIDKATGCCHTAPLPTTQAANFNVLCHLFFEKSMAKDVFGTVQKLKPCWDVKNSAQHLFEIPEYENLHTLKFHAPNHVREDMNLFENISFQDESPYEHFNYIVKRFIRSTSGYYGTTLEARAKGMKLSSAVRSDERKEAGACSV